MAAVALAEDKCVNKMKLKMKKKYMYAVACSVLCSAQAMAQTAYDAARYAGDELNGTARFVGMGGAMSALGADISVIGTNPAGIGLFRGHDVSTSFGMNITKAESDFNGSVMNDKRNKASFDQIGFVYSTKIGNRTTLRYLNFGFNYHKSRNFNRVLAAGGMLGGLSQTQQMANLVGGSIHSISDMDDIYNYGLEGHSGLSNPYDPYYSNYPYLGVMGIRTELVGVGTLSNGKQAPMGWNGNANGFRSREEGGINEYDFNVAFNVEDRMYFGITLGVNDVNYTRSTYYSEDVYDGNHSGYYELRNAFRTEGTGLNLKLGAIFRPIEDSPFRFGLAIHTPTWYSLTDKHSSEIYSELNYKFEDEADNMQFKADERTTTYAGESLQDYRLVTPWKFNVSAGTTLGSALALGAEYEYAGYNACQMSYNDGTPMENQNQYTKSILKGQHTVRIGAEARIASAFSVRAGYNFSTSAFKDGAYKSLNANDIRTDTEYMNDLSRNTVTVGLGYRGKWFYTDLAYKYDVYKSDFYAFSSEALPVTKVTNERHQLLLTLGVHF